MNENVRNTPKPFNPVLGVVRFVVGLRGRADPLGKV
jgi:hypothetical protein